MVSNQCLRISRHFFFGEGGVLMQIPCENEDWGESRGEKKLSDVMRHY